MKAKRQRHQSALKAKVGLEALAEVTTVAVIAREYQVHPRKVSHWKGAIADQLPEVFEHRATVEAEASEREVLRQFVGFNCSASQPASCRRP